MRRTWTGIAFASPALVYFVAFWLLPVAMAAFYSFTNWRLTPDFDFVGLDNYIRLANDPRFLWSIQITLVMSVAIAAASTVIALGVALMLDDPRIRFTNALRALFFLPVVTDWVATGLVWQFIYLPFEGVLAGILLPLGLTEWAGLRWTSSRALAPAAVSIFAIWKLTGLYIIIFSAGLRSVPESYKEAARVAGANTWHIFRFVTLPLIAPITLFVVLISFVTAAGLFEPIFILTAGGPVDATRTLPLFMYETFFSYQQGGYASAQSIIALAITLTIALIAAGRLQYSFYEE